MSLPGSQVTREADLTVFHSADSPTSPGPWEADKGSLAGLSWQLPN